MPLITTESKGVFVIAVTPFTDTLAVDMASVDSVTDFYFDKGADGLTILGMMGEAPKLTQGEALDITRRTLARAEGRPVVVGVSAPGLAAIDELTKAVMDLGAAGVMVARPARSRPTIRSLPITRAWSTPSAPTCPWCCRISRW